MIKAIVLIPFKDKENGNVYKKGDIVEFTAKRFNEITKKGAYIEAYEEKTKKDK